MILGLKAQFKDQGHKADQDQDLVQDPGPGLDQGPDREVLLNKIPNLKLIKRPRITILKKPTLLLRKNHLNLDQFLDQNQDQDPGLSRLDPRDPSLDLLIDPDPNLDHLIDPDPNLDPRIDLDPQLDPSLDPRIDPDLRPDPSLDHQHQEGAQGLPHEIAQDLDRGQDQLRPS